MHGYGYRPDLRMLGQNRTRNGSRGRFQQTVFRAFECSDSRCNDVAVRDRVLDVVTVRRSSQIDRQLQIDSETLSQLAFVLQQTMTSVHEQPFDEDRIAHASLSR